MTSTQRRPSTAEIPDVHSPDQSRILDSDPTAEATDSFETVVELPPRLALELDDGRRIPLPTQGELSIGTATGNDIRLDDRYVSHHHARIHCGGRAPRVVDLASKNGTWFDGVRVERAWLAIGACLRLGRTRAVVVPASPSPPRLVDASGAACRLLAATPSAGRLLRTLGKLANLRQPVLIRGESGTGKELIARTLHECGRRANQPWIAINCAAIPESLAESELFGHVRGAFTGAVRGHVGAFERAGDGTLFLDEIAELPLLLQAKLLRTLETQHVVPVGSEREVLVRARIITATHRDLEAMVSDGLFREDLYHRLTVFTVDSAPLRDRPEDVATLIDVFAQQAAIELGCERVTVAPEAIRRAQQHNWPGNVRGLRNAVFRAAALGDGHIDVSGLLGETTPDHPSPLGHGRASPSAASPLGMRGVPDAIAGTIEQARDGEGTFVIEDGRWNDMHQALLRQAIDRAGSIRRASAALGVPRSTIQKWLRRHDDEAAGP